LDKLHQRNIQSVIVEGGLQTLNTFINSNLWDEARIFTSKKTLEKGIQSPVIQRVTSNSEVVGGDNLNYIFNS